MDNNSFIAEQLSKIIGQGEVFEVRALDCPDRPGGAYRRNLSGYFDNIDAASKAIEDLEQRGPAGIYVTLNPVDPDLLSRCNNRIDSAKNSTADGDIVSRRWIFIDIDPERKSGISSTDEERANAKLDAVRVMKYLASHGFGEPLVASSGNGWHLLYRVELENTAESRDLIQRLLEDLAKRFNSEHSKIDTSVHNASRIIRCYGTTARKGDSTEKRPHRKSQIVFCPRELVPVSVDAIEAIVPAKLNIEPRKIIGSEFDLPTWLHEHRVPIREKETYKGGTKYFFSEKPALCGDHGWHDKCKDAFIVVNSDGKIAASCSHNRCNWGWKDLRQHYQPGCYDQNKTEKNLPAIAHNSAAAKAVPSAPIPDIDLSGESDEESLLEDWVPKEGLIKDVFEFYKQVSIAPSPIMGMATSMAFIEMLLGQKLQSHTELRTNDYNVVLGPTGSGKEACEKTISKILSACDSGNYIMPAGVQSGNGMLGYLAENPVCVWVKDEFGAYLENVVGKKKQPMEAQVGRFLLELYNKGDTRYSGNAHAAGVKHAIEQPHLVLLGLSTYGTIFDHLTFKDVENGLINRIAFWCVTEMPQWKTGVINSTPKDSLINVVKRWLDFAPSENEKPKPIVLAMDAQAEQRWIDHRTAIRQRSDREDTGRASMWSRTAARTMKFALCHRASRLCGPEAISEFYTPPIELEDVNWAIRLSNYLTRSACSLIEANTTNTSKSKAALIILDFCSKLPEGQWLNIRQIQRARRIVKGDLIAAAERLEAEGKLQIDKSNYGSKERIQVRLPSE